MAETDKAREWRIRPWIRGAVVLVFLLLSAQQINVIRHVGRGDMPDNELWYGYGFLLTFAIAAWFFAFRPRVVLGQDGLVTIVNPFRDVSFPADQVLDVHPIPYGLAFELGDGRRPWTIVFQATMSIGEPRWFDVAEAVTGTRPELPSDDGDNA